MRQEVGNYKNLLQITNLCLEGYIKIKLGMGEREKIPTSNFTFPTSK